MTSQWLAFIHSLDVKQNKPFLKPVSQHHTLSASKRPWNYLVQLFQLPGEEMEVQKGSKLGSGSWKRTPSPLTSTFSTLFYPDARDTHTESLYRKSSWIGNYYKKRAGRVCGFEEEAGKIPF